MLIHAELMNNYRVLCAFLKGFWIAGIVRRNPGALLKNQVSKIDRRMRIGLPESSAPG